MPRPPLTKRLGVALLLCGVVALVATSAGGCGLLDTFHLEITEYTCESPEIPPAFDGLRVAFLTDIHLGPTYTEQDLESVVGLVNLLQPDLVLLGGDYVYGSTDYESACFAYLAELEAPLGCFAVLGNHDYAPSAAAEPGPGQAVRAANDAGINLLRNQGIWLQIEGQRIRLGGVEDYQVGHPQWEPIGQGTNTDDFVLLVSHNPDFSEDLPPDAVDLVLSGHTHGGQVTIFGSWGLRVPSEYGQKYRTGIVENDVTTVIVSNGVGTSTPVPLRLFAPAQVVVLTLRAADSPSVHP